MNINDLKTAQDFYNFYEAIPEERWCKKVYRNQDGQCCAVGHLQEVLPDIHDFETVKSRLYKLIPGPFTIVELNDGEPISFLSRTHSKADIEKLGATPRQRILNALKSLL